MDHVAIMKKSLGMIERILIEQKSIESRWYKTKVSPWKSIRAKDTVYFKNAGEPVTVEAKVKDVKFFENLTPTNVKDLINQYKKEIGFEESELSLAIETYKNKRYCILIYLENPKSIPPFEINKTGYGMGCAWICIDDINKIKK